MAPPQIDSINNLLIVGNGFDLDLGLPTSYHDFLNSQAFHIISKRASKPNEIAVHLLGVQEQNNWVDIEQELAKYSMKLFNESSNNSRASLKSDYEELCITLAKYIAGIDVSKFNRGSRAYSVITSLMKMGGLSVIDFNYTDTVKTILDEFEKPYEHIQVHGNAKDDTIVFGVQDLIQLAPDDIFLRKSISPYLHTDWLVGSAISKTHGKVAIFGHSMGASDHTQFLPFFESKPKPIDLDIHFHNEQSRIDLWKQIEILTLGEIFEFRAFHNFDMLGPK